MKTENFEMTLMEHSQIGKEVIYNESINKIDSLLSTSIKDFIQNLPRRFDGNNYILKSPSYSSKIAIANFITKNWEIFTPKNGMIFFVRSNNKFFIFNINKWEEIDQNFSEISLIIEKLKSEEFRKSKLPRAASERREGGEGLGSSSFDSQILAESVRSLEKKISNIKEALLSKEDVIKILSDDALKEIIKSEISSLIKRGYLPEKDERAEGFIAIEHHHVLDGDKDVFYLFVKNDTIIDATNLKSKSVTLILKQNDSEEFMVRFTNNILWKNEKHYDITKQLNHMDIIRLHKLPETFHYLGEIVCQGYRY